MADEDLGGFAAPPFDADEALQRLRRELRTLGLLEREGRFERRGIAIAKAAIGEDGSLRAAWVKKPSRNSPEWVVRTLPSSAAVRDFVAELKRKLAGWGDDDD